MLPGEEDSHVMVVWMCLVPRVDHLLPLTEAPEGVVCVVVDLKSLREERGRVAQSLSLNTP